MLEPSREHLHNRLTADEYRELVTRSAEQLVSHAPKLLRAEGALFFTMPSLFAAQVQFAIRYRVMTPAEHAAHDDMMRRLHILQGQQQLSRMPPSF
jgi:tRNA G10  N-methylase Trm11